MGYWGIIQAYLAQGKTTIINDSWTLPGPTVAYTLYHTTTDRGLLRMALCDASPVVGTELAGLRIAIDDAVIEPTGTFAELNDTYTLDHTTRPVQLLAYAINGYCCYLLQFPTPIRFDETIKIYGMTTGVNDVGIDIHLVYEKAS